MANRKQLKKSIKMITGDLFADCVALSMCQQADQATLDSLMKEIIALHGDFVARISHTEKGCILPTYSTNLCMRINKKISATLFITSSFLYLFAYIVFDNKIARPTH